MSVSEPGKITTPWATGGLKNAIPANANPATGNAGYDQGFPAVNMTPKVAGGIPPFGQDFNGVLFEITTILRYMQAGGMPTFSSSLSTAIGGYPKGAVIIAADGVTQYQNQVDGNTNDPNANTTGWLPIVSNSYPIGAPIPWSTSVPPTGFLAMTGQSFSAATYPKLALAYPSLVLPDMRAEFIRGWDNGRGVDTGRGMVTAQKGSVVSIDQNISDTAATGAIGATSQSAAGLDNLSGTDLTGLNVAAFATSSPSVTSPSNSNSGVIRPRNTSFNYIVRAA